MQTPPKGTKERIKVFARCRPPQQEENDDFKSCVEFRGSDIKISRPNHQPKTFTFDGLFGPDSTQQQVFKTVSLDAIEDVFNGYHSTIFVYGQTGTGKHTLSNIDDNRPNENGLVPRCIQEIFSRIAIDPDHEYRVRMNYLQIYMETLQDLLQPDHKNLQIREDPELGIYVSGISFREISTFEECLKYYREGDSNRVTALTKMNASSSRSHSCLIINVQKSGRISGGKEEMEGLDKKKVTTANLFLVDLAGSERLKKTEAEGIRKKEANYINLSLTTLGIVIHSLEANHAHIPFRDSKLTRLLQDSLGGNGKTRIVITISPSVINSQETIGSLMFGERAMNVKTSAKINESVDYRALYVKIKAQLESLEEKYSELEEDYLDVTNENDKMDLEIDSLLEENNKLVKEKKILEKEKEKEKEKIVSLMKGDLLDLEIQHEQQIKELNDRFSGFSKECELEFHKKEEKLKKIVLEKESDTDRLELLVQELSSDKTFLENKVSDLENQVETLTVTTCQLESELETTSNLCCRRENELEQVQELIQQLDNQITSQKETIIKNVDELDMMRTKMLLRNEEIENTKIQLLATEKELTDKKQENCSLNENIEHLKLQIYNEKENTQQEIRKRCQQEELLEYELQKERERSTIMHKEKQYEIDNLQDLMLHQRNTDNESKKLKDLEIERLNSILCDERLLRERERELDKEEKKKEREEKESIVLELQYYKDKIQQFTSKVFSSPPINNTTILNVVEETSDQSSILQAPPIPIIEKVPIFDFGKIVNVQTNVINRYQQQFLSQILNNFILEQQMESMLDSIKQLEIGNEELKEELLKKNKDKEELVKKNEKLTTDKQELVKKNEEMEKKNEELKKDMDVLRSNIESIHLEISTTYSHSIISNHQQDDVRTSSDLLGSQLHQILFDNDGCNARSVEIINGELKDLKFISKKSKEESPEEASHDAINYMIWALEYSHPYSSFSDNLLGEENSKEIIKSLLAESEKRVKSSSKTSAEHTLEIDRIWKHVKKTMDCFYDSSTDGYKSILENIDCNEYQSLFSRNYLRQKETSSREINTTEQEQNDQQQQQQYNCKSIHDLVSDSREMLSKTSRNCLESSENNKLLSYWLLMSNRCLQKVLNREEINHKAGVYLMHEFIHLLHTARNVLYLFDCSERDVLIYKLALHGCASKLSKFINSNEEVRKEMEDRIASYEDLRTRNEAALIIQRFFRKTKRKMQEEFVRKQRTELIAQSQAQMIKIRELQKSELNFKATVGKQIADTGRILIKQGVSEIDHIFNILKTYFLYGEEDETPLSSPSSPRGAASSGIVTTPERQRSGSLSPSPPNPLRENFGGRPKSIVSRAYSKNRFSEIDVAEINDIVGASSSPSSSSSSTINNNISPTARKVLVKSLPSALTKRDSKQ